LGGLRVTVREQVEDVFRNLFNDDSIVLSDDLTAADVPGWDSLAHINLMFSLEQEFGIQFADDEFTQFENVGELLRLIEERVTGAPSG
jgi:acyl carrier protein